jgi:hypothetical protein
MKTKKILKENEIVLNFIKNWQSKNEYNPLFLNEYNNKFNAEFNHFLKNSEFSNETIELFEL